MSSNALMQCHVLTRTHTSSHLHKKLVWRFDKTECCCNAWCHTDHTKNIADTWRGLWWQASQCSNTAQWCSQICHLMNVWIQPGLCRIRVATDECSCRNCVQVTVFRWVGYTDHILHLSSSEMTSAMFTASTHSCRGGGGGLQRLHCTANRLTNSSKL